jgi:basic membrane protein A and related proteins
MSRKRFGLVALIAALALVAAACGDDDATTTTAGPAAFKGCQITDTGGIDDKTFNETAWNGMLQAQAQLGAEVSFLESQDATDFRPNIDSSIAAGCDLVLTVGFLIADDTGAAAADNPDQLFAIIDFPVYPGDPWLDANGEMVTNVRGLTYATDQAAFLAGYLAAGVTQTGVIGTFGGINIPSVTVFMDGFVLGARHYDSVHGTTTTVLGWDPEAETGLFTNNFVSLDDGRSFAQNLMDEGADIILPVAGPVGLGSAAAIQEANAAGANVMLIGVDTDMYISAPEYGDILLVSILKNMDVSVFDTIQTIIDTGGIGDEYVGTLENDGVGLSPFHDFDGIVPDSLRAELDAITAEIIAGTIQTSPAR